jgi:dethiobiotin synthetase
MKQTFFITGTDTGVGKTVLTAWLAWFLRGRGLKVAALKPICSGGRADGRALHAALGGALTLDEINPWHFRAPVTPALAAKLEKRSVKLPQVLAQVRALQKRFEILLIEGAGGLLSPLGESFNSRDLIAALRATPIIVAPDKLGVVNHVLLTFGALPKSARLKTKVFLMSPPKPDSATGSNAKLLGQVMPSGRIFTLPWLRENFSTAEALKKPQVKRTLAALLK